MPSAPRLPGKAAIRPDSTGPCEGLPPAPQPHSQGLWSHGKQGWLLKIQFILVVVLTKVIQAHY